MNSVWSLCQSLWGDLEELDLLNIKDRSGVNPYEIHQLRKKCLTKWLADVSSNRIEREVKLFKYHKVYFFSFHLGLKQFLRSISKTVALSRPFITN